MAVAARRRVTCLPGFVANTNGIVHVRPLGRDLRLHRRRVHDRERRGRQATSGQGRRGRRAPSTRRSTPPRPTSSATWSSSGQQALRRRRLRPDERRPAARARRCSTRPPVRSIPTFDPNADGTGQHRRHQPCRHRSSTWRACSRRSAGSRPCADRGQPDDRRRSQGPTSRPLQDYVRDVTVGPDGLVYAAVGGQDEQRLRPRPDDGRAGVASARPTATCRPSSTATATSSSASTTASRSTACAATRCGSWPPTRRPAPSTRASCRSPAPTRVCSTIDADGTYLAVGGYFGRMGGTSVNGLSIHP